MKLFYIFIFAIKSLISIDRIYIKSKTHTQTHSFTHTLTHTRASRYIEHYRNIIVRITYRGWIANRFKHSHLFEALRQIPFLVARKQSLILVSGADWWISSELTSWMRELEKRKRKKKLKKKKKKKEKIQAHPETCEMIRFCHVPIVPAIDVTPLPVRACACHSCVSLLQCEDAES